MPPEPRPAIQLSSPVAHGAAQVDELAVHRLSPVDVIDFSVNTNPLGPPPRLLEAIARADVSRYPHTTADPLRRAIAASLGVDPDSVVAGNGSMELIWLLALAYARPGPERAVISVPTFGEYARACRLMGAVIMEIWPPAYGRRHDSFQLDVDGLAEAIATARPRLAWVCNPNNPTGAYLAHDQVAQLAGAAERAGTLLVVDEAYLAFAPQRDDLLDLVAGGHVFLLRSMTKDYALPGLRLGYGIGSADVAAALRAAQPPWSVSAPAQAAGIAALDEADYLARAREEVAAARQMLADGLAARGFTVAPSSANFLLVDARAAGTALQQDGAPTGARLRTRLLRRGTVVRDCASFGLPDYVRIAVRTRAECVRLLDALDGLGAG